MQAIKLKTDEQVKMSRNLHDGVAQDLAALKLYLETDDKEKAKFYATQAFKEIRYLIGSLHLDLSNDLEKTIQQILRVFEANYGIQTHFYFASDLIVQFSQDIIIEFIRILQETLSNIARHANATEVTVKFIDVSDKLKFIISDNGVGFKIEEMLNLNPEDKMSHYGLSNIQERVRLLGGTVEFVNEGGMTIAITI